MALHHNSQQLILNIEGLPTLNGRYEKINVINVIHGHTKRGCFSLVFRAHDRLNGKDVALKFYDIDPNWLQDRYRLEAFEREHEILQKMQEKSRCLQLESALSTYGFVINTQAGPMTIPCQYFATEWLENDIDNYFLGTQPIDAIKKLKIFNEITLAINSLHALNIHHRDIKADNLRLRTSEDKNTVVAIDLGTAAHYSSPKIQQHYQHSVGAPAYAAPEAHCGLAGNRLIAPYTDLYALGCLLFELFNPNYFYLELKKINPTYDMTLMGISSLLTPPKDEQDHLKKWSHALGKLGKGINKVNIDSLGHTVPAGIIHILNDILQALTHVDYKQRRDLQWVQRKIWSAIRTLENESEYQHRLKLAKIRRDNRERNIQRAQERLNNYLKGKKDANSKG